MCVTVLPFQWVDSSSGSVYIRALSDPCAVKFGCVWIRVYLCIVCVCACTGEREEGREIAWQS